ncbi:MAG: hypothetical protein LBO80_02525 [Treponema sp.]|jgi:hypothetical protein|nr:hypothetical protein [Treponema sp.]
MKLSFALHGKILAGFFPSWVQNLEQAAMNALARTGAAGGTGVSYLRDNLKSLGVYEGGFMFFGLGAEMRFFWEWAAVFVLFILRPAVGLCFPGIWPCSRER